MSHLRLDDGFMEHPTTGPLTAGAKLLHIAGMLYCARNLTDGLLEGKAVRVVMLSAEARRKHLAELVDVGCWTATETGYEIRGYLDHNLSAEKVKANRVAAKDRMTRARSREQTPNVPPKLDEVFGDPLLSSPLKSVSSSSTSSRPEETEGKVDELLQIATTPSDRTKLERAIQARKPSYETITRALDAAQAPCDSPIAVALAIIAPKRRAA